MGITRFRGRQIQDDTVTSADITDHSITADDIAIGSLDGAMFINGSIPAIKIDQSSFPFSLSDGSVIAVSSLSAALGKVLTVSGTGTANWQTPTGGGGSPASGEGSLQFNASGSFGSNPTNLFWDNTNRQLAIGVSDIPANAHARLQLNSRVDIPYPSSLAFRQGNASEYGFDFMHDAIVDGNLRLDTVINGAHATLVTFDRDNHRVGIGTVAPDTKLHVAGSVKIVDGSEGANKVLLSDASGLATWAGIVTDGFDVLVDEDSGEVIFA